MTINGVISDISSAGILISGNFYGGTSTIAGGGTGGSASKAFAQIPTGVITNSSGVLMNVTSSPVVPELGLLFINGDLLLGSVYSSGTTIDTADKEWAKTGNVITVKPGVIQPDLTPEDVLLYGGFSEVAASTGVRIEHYKGYLGTGVANAKTLQQTPIDPSKVVVWLNGRALFASNGGVGVIGNQVHINGTAEGYSANDSIPASADLHWTVMYFTDSVYASRWTFENIHISTSTWGSGTETGVLSKPVDNVNNSFLFCNGQRECPGQYGVSPAGNTLINNSLNSTISSTDELVLIY